MLQPIGDRVIVKVKEEEEKTVGGIVLASNAKQKPTEGEVVAVGEGAYTTNFQWSLRRATLFFTISTQALMLNTKVKST